MAVLPIMEWMESQSRDALCIVFYYVAGGPEYCAKINFVPSDRIFNLGESEMLIPAGRRVDIVAFLQANVDMAQTQLIVIEHLTSP